MISSGQLLAITREVSPAIGACALTHLDRKPIDLLRAFAQHQAYQSLLAELGCTVTTLPVSPDLPDSVFVEDAAVVLDELAIITRPGHATRRREAAEILEAIKPHRSVIHTIEAPATLDGGDVLLVGRTIMVGLSSRTTVDGARQLERIATPVGYDVHTLGVEHCLHLKSACTVLDDRTLLANPGWLAGAALPSHFDVVEVHVDEPSAANVVRVGDKIICAEAYPRTRQHLEERGYDTRAIDASELAKAEGGLTCCSLIFNAAPASV